MDNENITMTKRDFIKHMMEAYRVGSVNSLLAIKKPIPEIAKILRMTEEKVEKLKQEFFEDIS